MPVTTYEVTEVWTLIMKFEAKCNWIKSSAVENTPMSQVHAQFSSVSIPSPLCNSCGSGHEHSPMSHQTLAAMACV